MGRTGLFALPGISGKINYKIRSLSCAIKPFNMKKLFLFAVLSFCFVLKNYGQDWITFNSPEGKFSALLPTKPSTQTDTSNGYPYYTTNLFISRTNTDFFVIGWVDYETSYKFDAQKELEANRDNFIKGINGTLVSTNNTKFNGYQAVEFVTQSGSLYWTSKVFLVGRRPYQLLAGSTTGKAPENLERFYNSFSIKND